MERGAALKEKMDRVALGGRMGKFSDVNQSKKNSCRFTWNGREEQGRCIEGGSSNVESTLGKNPRAVVLNYNSPKFKGFSAI